MGGYQLYTGVFSDFRSRLLTIVLHLETICGPCRPSRNDLERHCRGMMKRGPGVAMCGRTNERRATSACLLLIERKPPARLLPRPAVAVLAPGRSYKTPEGFPRRSLLHANFEERKRPAMKKRKEAAVGHLGVRDRGGRRRHVGRSHRLD